MFLDRRYPDGLIVSVGLASSADTNVTLQVSDFRLEEWYGKPLKKGIIVLIWLSYGEYLLKGMVNHKTGKTIYLEWPTEVVWPDVGEPIGARVKRIMVFSQDNSVFEDVHEFQDKFQITQPKKPQLPSDELLKLKLMHLAEELSEIHEGVDLKDIPSIADGAIDLIYVAVSLLDAMGVPMNLLWNEVHKCNMTKMRAESSGQSKRGSQLDIIKPIGWEEPKIADIIIKFLHAKDDENDNS